MYSGTTLHKHSGNLVGVHQKIDRIARRHLARSLPAWCDFPSSKEILKFEGNKGPDGIKRKSPAVDEPWHFIRPDKPDDVELLDTIDQHIKNLSQALKNHNQQRSAFEAAWLSHAIVDGLTPVHQSPFEEQLIEIRGGQGVETRDSLIKKNVMPGESALEFMKNNWKYWGAKGVMTVHSGFEFGVASAARYKRFPTGLPTEDDIKQMREIGFRTYYLGCVHQVFDMKMVEKYIKRGWTASLARQTNKQLMPLIIRAVVLGWIAAVDEVKN